MDSHSQSVLESVGRDQDRAIDMLLGMNDPNYVSQEPPAPVQVRSYILKETKFASLICASL
jgi:hypothetical protein